MSAQLLAIGDFCSTGSGTTPSRAEADRYYGGSIPWVKSGELREAIIRSTSETVTEAALSETALRIAPAGSILIAMYGATVGRLAVLGIPATTNQAVCHIVPDPKRADGRYVFHALQHKVPYFLGRSVGGAQPNISQQIIKDAQIPLPPLSEQRRIAAILDAADSLRHKRKQAPHLLDQLAQSMFLDMFGDLSVNDRGWRMAEVQDFVAGFESGKSLVADDEEDTTSKYRVLKVSAVTSLFYRPQESKPLPPDYMPPDSHVVRQGDLLFSRANTSQLIGATALVDHAPPNHVLPDKIWRFVWHDEPRADPYFVWHLFRQRRFRDAISSRATGTSGSMKNISQNKVLSIPIALPPLNLQQEFGRQLKATLNSRAHSEAALQKQEVLFSSLQHRAFRGGL